MVDIHSVTAEISRGKKRRRRRKKKPQDDNIMSASATQGGHIYSVPFYRLAARFNHRCIPRHLVLALKIFEDKFWWPLAKPWPWIQILFLIWGLGVATWRRTHKTKYTERNCPCRKHTIKSKLLHILIIKSQNKSGYDNNFFFSVEEWKKMSNCMQWRVWTVTSKQSNLWPRYLPC